MRAIWILWASVAMAACGATDELEAKLVDGTPEALAEVLPKDLFAPSSGASLLPATITAGESLARIKADGWDPRDDYPIFAFTGAPGDVEVLPAESEPIKALLIGWPGGASNLTSFFAGVIKAASSEVSTVIVYVPSQTVANGLYSALSSAGAPLSKIKFLKLSLDTIWMRDYGPLMVRANNSSGYRVVDLRYYYGRWNDDAAPSRLATAWQVPVSRPPLELEGGNFQSDGAGTCIATTQVLKQNSGYTTQKVKSLFQQYLGCQSTLILPALDGEGTGHVDMYVTITGPRQAIVGQYSSADDSYNAKIADQGAAILKAAGFTVHRIPMPTNYDGAYRSYTNSLAVGKRVLVPVYSDDRRYESQALAVFKKAYPGFTIVPIDSTQVIQMAGAIHCVTITLGN
jgi:agmatine deiminase